MIRNIIHIADLHIPNDEKNRPYSEMIKQGLAEVLKVVKKYKDDEEDAEEEESTDENNTVEVGEYYISRLDEAEFV